MTCSDPTNPGKELLAQLVAVPTTEWQPLLATAAQSTLVGLLETVECRLGTLCEQARDFDLCQHLGHELKNRWMAELMRDYLGE